MTEFSRSASIGLLSIRQSKHVCVAPERRGRIKGASI